MDAAVDWAKGYQFLDKELQSVSYGAVVDRRSADKLVKVWLKNGEEAWVLAHIEAQGQEEENFAQRMFIYHYWPYERYERQAISMAILTDEQPEWRPDTFGYELCGCRIELRFPIIKLLDYRQDWDWLESSESLFATVVMIHLKAEERFWQELPQYERSKKIPYITIIECVDIRKDIEQGIEQGII